MKRLSLILLALIVFPTMLSAQYKVKAVHEEPIDLKVDIPGYNANVPVASMNVNFLYDQEKETLTVRLSKGTTTCDYNKIWLPQHDITVNEMGSYMKSRGVKLKKAQTFSDQENFLNLSSRTLSASIQAQGMTFSGVYDLKSPKKVKKQLDHQMVPLDGVMELDLVFNVTPKAKNGTLILKNPIPMNRKGRKGYAAFVADDLTINIEFGRCKNADELINTIKEYNAIFTVAEDKLVELKKSPTTQKGYYNFIVKMYDEIDLDRFESATCDEVQQGFGQLKRTKQRMDDMMRTTPPPPPTSNCNVSSLNAEIKSTTTKLNNMVNDWSLAPDAATKAEKKAAFEAAVQKFDGKLNDLPSDCRNKLDAKLLKNYEFVKKLVK